MIASPIRYRTNALTQCDFYKIDHRRQYPEGTTMVYSNLTPRSNKLSSCHQSPFYDGKMVVFGTQYFVRYLHNLFRDNFFNEPKAEIVSAFKRRIETSLGKDAITYEHIEALHDLGYLPIKIKGLPEGVRVNMKVPILTIVNTLPEFFWITNFLETILSATVWKLCTNASVAFEYKRILSHYAQKTGADMNLIQFQGHDFSFRGMSGNIDAAASGMAHLTSFVGTDTIPAIDMAEYYYDCNSDHDLIGCSVPASEHSVMCLGSQESEIETFRQFITELYPKGIVSIVSDTWDFWRVMYEYLPKLKDIIMSRDGKVVIRPDSGDPVDIICGTMDYHILKSTDFENEKSINNPDRICRFFSEPDFNIYNCLYHNVETNKYYQIGVSLLEVDGSCGDLWIEQEYEYIPKGAIECLWDIFGGTVNEKGYKVLDSHIGLIYGDSITLERANKILAKLEEKGFASSNIVFGVGSYTYQYSTRDSFGMAVKSTYGEVNGEGREIFKSPKTDNGIKNSAKSLLSVDMVAGEYILKDLVSREEENHGGLFTIYHDGNFHNRQSLTEVRGRINKDINKFLVESK